MMDEQERLKLAQHLASLKYGKARSEILKLDPGARLKFWRNAVGYKEWHTTYELPNLGLRITLVEDPIKEAISDSHLVRSKPEYVEARVEPLMHPFGG